MKILGVIPARFASTRFPGKPLVDIAGKTMIRRVYEQASKSSALCEVVVATDDHRIFEHVNSFGGRAIMTSTAHRSGTERCAEVLEGSKESFNVVINIQGDEPFIQPEQLDLLAACFLDQSVQIATLAKKIRDNKLLFDQNVPKVIFNKKLEAIYFSRAVIPFHRGIETHDWIDLHDYYKHIGIYAYRADVLKKIANLEPTPLEKAESLEQLRWLENGYRIHIRTTEHESVSIDVPEDLGKIDEQMLRD